MKCNDIKNGRNKREFVEVIKLNQTNLDENNKIVNIENDNITRVSSYNFLIKILETYNKRKFDNNERVEAYIVCNLSSIEEKAEKQWFQGIEYDNHIYKAWFSTVGGMKQEENGICDTIFVREDYIEFAKMTEKLISLGKFTELESLDENDEKKNICINKDVLSRLSLMTSDLISEIDMPNTIVLKNGTLDFKRTYKTVKAIKSTETDKKGNEIEKVDYELIDYNFDTVKNENDEIEINDGYGLATPKVFDSINKSLNRTDVDFAIIRAFGNSTKGLITKFDILEYMNEFYVKDTDTCKKVNNKFYLKDYWGTFQLVTDNTILLNDSMVKLAKMFDSKEEYDNRLEQLNSVKNKDYYNLLNKLYITKVNKRESDIKDYRRTNYQLINALALTPQNYQTLVEADMKLFTKILKPFNCINSASSTKEFEVNLDYINIFFNNLANENDSECENFVDKTNELLQINKDFVKLKYVKDSLANIVEKKIRELASARITVKAKYQYLACCPISLMNYAMTQNQGINGLNKNEFYSADCANADIRTISRNPLSAYSEVHNVQFVKNELLDKYLCQSKELIYFNQKSDIQNLLSSADFDGDAVLSIDNKIIREAVVVPQDDKYFITLSDGETQKLVYNNQNRFVSTYRAAGNLIGQIALKAVSVNSNAQSTYTYYNTQSKRFLNRNTIKIKYAQKNNGKIDDFEQFIEALIKKGTLVYVDQVDESIQNKLKELMIQEFYEYEKEIYIVLYNSMKSIDAPKTLIFPNKSDMQVINSKYFRKASFLQYTKSLYNVIENEYVYTNSLLNKQASIIQNKLLDNAENRKKDFNDNSKMLTKCFKNNKFDKEKIRIAIQEIQEIYKNYINDRDKAEKIFDRNKRKLNKKDTNYYLDSAQNRKTRNNAYKEIDKTYILNADDILNKYDLATICHAIYNLENCTEKFIIDIFFKCFEFVNENLNNDRYKYKKDEKGEIEYLHERYTKIKVKDYVNKTVVDRLHEEEKLRCRAERKIRFLMSDKNIIEEIKLDLENKQTYKLDLEDTRIEICEEYQKNIEKNEKFIEIKKFDINKNGNLAIANKSFGVIASV